MHAQDRPGQPYPVADYSPPRPKPAIAARSRRGGGISAQSALPPPGSVVYNPAAMAVRNSERLMDLRTINRNLRSGLLSREEVAEYLRTLPDVSGKLEVMTIPDGDDDDDAGEDEVDAAPEAAAAAPAVAPAVAPAAPTPEAPNS